MLLAVFHVENHEDREDFACVIAPPENTNTYVILGQQQKMYTPLLSNDITFFVFCLINLL